MIQPQDIYDYRDIIIPVIGNNCFVCNSGSEEISLQEFVVNKLTEGKNFNQDLLSQMKDRGYYGLTLLKKHCFPNKESKFKLEYKRTIDNNKEKIHLNKTIRRFLQVYKFPVVVTTSCFKLIETELPQYKSVSFPSAEGNQIKLNGEHKTVYHIFGLEANGAKWVTGEEELLNFVHELHGDGATDLKKYIKADNRMKALFVIGSNLPDWLFRFFLYPMTDFSNNEVGYFLSSSDSIEDSFMSFLDDISYDYDVNTNLESVLQDAISLFPAADSSIEFSNRVTHNKEYDIFISYASENRELACDIRDRLHDDYGLNVWLDQKQIIDGDYEKRIIKGIDNSAYFMPIVTKEYILKHKPVFNAYKSIDDIVNDNKLEFVQMETLIAEKHRKELQRIAYSLPIVISAPIGEKGTLDFDMIEKKYAESCLLPGNLFRRQQMFYYEEMFDGRNDWGNYKTIEK